MAFIFYETEKQRFLKTLYSIWWLFIKTIVPLSSWNLERLLTYQNLFLPLMHANVYCLLVHALQVA